MSDFDFKKKKKYGQNFLTSDRIPKKIVEQSGITKDFGVIEIGAGQGILTQQLLNTAKNVISVEIDEELIPFLNEKFKNYNNFLLINDDILKVDLNKYIESHFKEMSVAVCANLPYYITTPILMKLLEGKHGFKTITVMVQKEVASRLVSFKGDKEYGAITAVCNYYANVKKLFNVSAGCFSPPPKVDSAVIRFDLYDAPPVKLDNEKLFFDVIKAAFNQRRKTFVNSSNSFFNNNYSKDLITEILNELNKNINIRGEELDIHDFAFISNKLNKYTLEEKQ
ncbi:16S rRNA (adenine(1518)-N(6)/adenine(1519)-N(6))-dimethyltransferase RsmA [Eubacteriales bacterium OttesenSCG-928-G02]|nr:16S rRNA (adenine(1518)-N(6)/adenine(1519)-N(6))-dimethyltransferase RsmA [Eubacteriales bacterium OttesenSCG-928-G02]